MVSFVGIWREKILHNNLPSQKFLWRHTGPPASMLDRQIVIKPVLYVYDFYANILNTFLSIGGLYLIMFPIYCVL